MAAAKDGRSKRSQADRQQSGHAGAGSGESRGIRRRSLRSEGRRPRPNPRAASVVPGAGLSPDPARVLPSVIVAGSSTNTAAMPSDATVTTPVTLIASSGSTRSIQSAAGPTRTIRPVAVPSSRVKPSGCRSTTKPPTRTVEPTRLCQVGEVGSGRGGTAGGRTRCVGVARPGHRAADRRACPRRCGSRGSDAHVAAGAWQDRRALVGCAGISQSDDSDDLGRAALDQVPCSGSARPVVRRRPAAERRSRSPRASGRPACARCRPARRSRRAARHGSDSVVRRSVAGRAWWPSRAVRSTLLGAVEPRMRCRSARRRGSGCRRQEPRRPWAAGSRWRPWRPGRRSDGPCYRAGWRARSRPPRSRRPARSSGARSRSG